MQEGLSGGVSALHIPNPEAGEDVPTHHIKQGRGPGDAVLWKGSPSCSSLRELWD